MSHSSSSVTLEDVPSIVEALPPQVTSSAKAFLFFLVIIGICAFVIGIYGPDPKVAWISFQVNFIYWFCLAAASTCFAAVLNICDAQWSRPIRRLFEAPSSFFLFSFIPLLILFFGRHYLFVWSSESIEGKGIWLNPMFVYVRDVIGILILALLGHKLVFYSLRRDIGAIRSGLTGVKGEKVNRWSAKMYDGYVSSWGEDSRREIAQTTWKMAVLSPVIIIAYAFIMTLIAFDQIMSVDPHWYSTLFGAFVFMGAVYLAMAWCSIGVGFARELHPLFRAKIERRTLHDLGKLLFGFGIFWAYLFWSHYLTIWYGNMPEETSWIIVRMREDPWHSLAWIILGSCFIVPFLIGLSRDVKQVPTLLVLTGAIVACGLWLQHYLLFTPTLYPNSIPLSLIDVAIILGFMGAYILSAISFLEKVPLIPFGDLYS